MTYVCMPMHMYRTCDSIAITDPPQKKKKNYINTFMFLCTKTESNCKEFQFFQRRKINRHFVFTIIFNSLGPQIYLFEFGSLKVFQIHTKKKGLI